MDPNDPAAHYIPTIERALRDGIDLPEGKPAEEQRLAALLVYARLLRRKSWCEDTAVPWEQMAQIGRGEPPVPTDFAPRNHVRIEQEISMDTCGSCAATPGKMKCRVCNGTGLLSNMNLRCSCDGGFVRCPICRGEQRSSRVRLRYFNDEPVRFREAYIPSFISLIPALFSFEGAFERIIDLDAAPPEALRCHDLSDRVSTSTAYRGGGERRQKPDFKGHDFVDTIDNALAGLAALSAGAAVPLYDLRAYAWPILRLRYAQGAEIALFVNRLGGTEKFGA